MIAVLRTDLFLRLSLRRCSIFALSSGSLPSAIAIVRVSGPKARHCLETLTRKRNIKPRELFYAKIRQHDGELIDHGMAVFLPGPKTSTGEDTAEFYVHGSRAVVSCLSNALNCFENVRPAKAGEFTRRAFYNGKLNIHEVESLSYLLQAETERQRRLAIRHNAFGDAMEKLRARLIEIRAELEASIDFGDDVELDIEKLINDVGNILGDLENVSKRMKRGTYITDGVNVVIIGRTNVGKSSLLNRLAERDVAIVSDIDGTTRDTLEIRMNLASVPVVITDTAGMRIAGDRLEAEGIARTVKRAKESDILLVVVDVTKCNNLEIEVENVIAECDISKDTKIIVVCNKCDLLTRQQSFLPVKWPVITTSCITQFGIERLISAVTEAISSLCSVGDDNALLSRERHRTVVAEAIQILKKVAETKDVSMIAEYLREASDLIGEISGATVNEDILDQIFSAFCIGK